MKNLYCYENSTGLDTKMRCEDIKEKFYEQYSSRMIGMYSELSSVEKDVHEYTKNLYSKLIPNTITSKLDKAGFVTDIEFEIISPIDDTK